MMRLRMTTVTATTTATVAVAPMTGECRSSGALNTPVAAEAEGRFREVPGHSSYAVARTTDQAAQVWLGPV